MSNLKYRLTQKDYGDVPLGALDAMSDAADRIDALEAENKALRKALRDCVNFMENTESELGITLSSADRARALLAKGDGK